LRIKFALSTIAISFTIISFFVIGISYGQENQTSTYENTTEGIRYQYPSYWGNLSLENGCFNKNCELTLRPYNVADLSNPKFNFVLHKTYDGSSTKNPNCNCDTLTDFVKWTYDDAQQVFRDFIFINDSQTTVGKKYPAWQFEFSGAMKGLTDLTNATRLVIATKINSSFYSMIFYPFTDEVAPTIRKLVDTVEFFPPKTPKKPIIKVPSFMSTNVTEESLHEKSIDNNPSGLQILSHNSFTDSIGYLHVVGEIKNNYPSTVTFVKIVGTFYDVNNIVVGTDFTYTNPSDIGSGQTVPFELLLTSASLPISQIDHYNLQVTSQ
jgi:hypothetical protein